VGNMCAAAVVWTTGYVEEVNITAALVAGPSSAPVDRRRSSGENRARGTSARRSVVSHLSEVRDDDADIFSAVNRMSAFPKGLSSMDRAAAFARVAEKRQVTMAGFWGQAGLDKLSTPPKRELPAFWSLRTHGQPFNDARLTDGASNHIKVAGPPKLGAPPTKPAGPATESLATMKSSLQNGFALFNDDAHLTPLSMQPGTLAKLRQCEPRMLTGSCSTYKQVHKVAAGQTLSGENRNSLEVERLGRLGTP
jgi:hypothetical protein